MVEVIGMPYFISENLSPLRRVIFNVTASQRSNMGFLGNIFIYEKRIPFLLAWRIYKR
jgi:hypothetical protein